MQGFSWTGQWKLNRHEGWKLGMEWLFGGPTPIRHMRQGRCKNWAMKTLRRKVEIVEKEWSMGWNWRLAGQTSKGKSGNLHRQPKVALGTLLGEGFTPFGRPPVPAGLHGWPACRGAACGPASERIASCPTPSCTESRQRCTRERTCSARNASCHPAWCRRSLCRSAAHTSSARTSTAPPPSGRQSPGRRRACRWRRARMTAGPARWGRRCIPLRRQARTRPYQTLQMRSVSGGWGGQAQRHTGGQAADRLALRSSATRAAGARLTVDASCHHAGAAHAFHAGGAGDALAGVGAALAPRPAELVRWARTVVGAGCGRGGAVGVKPLALGCGLRGMQTCGHSLPAAPGEHLKVRLLPFCRQFGLLAGQVAAVQGCGKHWPSTHSWRPGQSLSLVQSAWQGSPCGSRVKRPWAEGSMRR